jgi:hypothetical protein
MRIVDVLASPNSITMESKQQLRQDFCEALCIANHTHIRKMGADTVYFDYANIFHKLLKDREMVDDMACYTILYDCTDEQQDPCAENQVLDALIFKPGFHVVHKHMFMSFFYFILKLNKGLAKAVFRHRRLLQEILFHKTFGMAEFDIMLAWDQEADAKIFRDEGGSFMLQLCNRVYISTQQVDKMKRIVQVYGSDLLNWIPQEGFYRKSFVNSFLFSGYIFRKLWHATAIETEVDYAVNFLVETCPQALRAFVIDETGKRIDGFTQVLYMRTSSNFEKDQTLTHNVFQHFTFADLYETTYTKDNHNFLDLVIMSRNNIVADFLQSHLNVLITFPFL